MTSSPLLSRVGQVFDGRSNVMWGLRRTSFKAAKESMASGKPITHNLWKDKSLPQGIRTTLGNSGIHQLQIEVIDPTTTSTKLASEIRTGIRELALSKTEEEQEIRLSGVKIKTTPQFKPNPKLKIVSDQIIAHIKKEPVFSLNNLRGELSQLVMYDKKLIPKFRAIIENLLAADKDQKPFFAKARILKNGLQSEFSKEERKELHWLMRVGFFFGRTGVFHLAFYSAFRFLFKETAKLFIAGENISQATKKIGILKNQGAGYIFDYVIEEEKEQEAADRNLNNYLDALGKLPSGDRFLSIKLSGLIPNLVPKTEAETVSEEQKREAIRILKILANKAKDNNATVVIDLEEYSVKDATIEIFERFHRATNYHYVDNIGIVQQTYLKESRDDIKRLTQFAEECYSATSEKGKLFVRFVKGAYPGKDAKYRLPTQEDTNISFVDCVNAALEAHDCFRIAVASHNLRTISEILNAVDEKGINRKEIEFEMLLGMPASPILGALSEMGHKVRYYLPVGDFNASLGYFTRRMEENANDDSCQKTFKLYQKGIIGKSEYQARAFSPVAVAA